MCYSTNDFFAAKPSQIIGHHSRLVIIQNKGVSHEFVEITVAKPIDEVKEQS